MQSFKQIGSKLWKIGAIQNRYPIVVYGVMIDSELRVKTLGQCIDNVTVKFVWNNLL